MNPSIRRLAATENTLLITGRTGTGKSYLAKKIHEMSFRKLGRFVVVNLATLSENLIESELFGHERGSFSGADQKRIGKLESANGGTVFLDEIGELTPRLQTKLLEALNSLTISPVGSNREIALNVRIITATNRDLAKMVREGTFREDLFFRINTFEINLPELRSLPENIATYANLFAKTAAQAQNRPFLGLSDTLLHELEGYSWPGNIRELKNAMEFAVAMSTEGFLSVENLPPHVKAGAKSVLSEQAYSFPTDYREAKNHFEKTYLEEVLFRCEGRINLTARRSGLSKVTLIDKIRRYQIDVPTIKYRSHVSGKVNV